MPATSSSGKSWEQRVAENPFQAIADDPPTVFEVIKVISEIVGVAAQVIGGIKAGKDALAIASSVIFHSKEFKSLAVRIAPAIAGYGGDNVAAHQETTARGSEFVANVLGELLLNAGNDVATAGEIAPLKSLAGEIEKQGPLMAAQAHANAGLLTKVVEELERPLNTMVEGFFRIFQEQIESQRAGLPGNVNKVAAGALTRALELGITAHFAAAGLEAVIPTFKNIGLNQIVGFIASLAGFDKIVGPAMGPTLKYGIGIPAEMQAARLFRTRRPSSSAVREQAFQRHVTLKDYRRALELEGLPDDWINVLVADTFIDPSPREITWMLDGAEVDPVWVAAKLKEVGWDDADVKRGTGAIQSRSQLPGRSRYTTELVSTFVAGDMDQRDFEQQLAGVVQDPDHRALWVGAASWAKARRVAGQLSTAIVKQYREDVIDGDTAGTMLDAIGLPDREVQLRLSLAALDRNQKLLKTETAELEVPMKALRSSTLTTLRAGVRSGELDPDRGVELIEMLGFARSYATTIVALELTRAGAEPAVETSPFYGFAVQTYQDALAAMLAEQVQLKKVAGIRAVELLVNAGVPLSPAETAIAIGAVISASTAVEVDWPFQDLSDSQLTWVSALEAIAARIAQGFGGNNAVSKAIDALGIGKPGRDTVVSLLTSINTIFGKGGTRGRAPASMQRVPPIPRPVVPPEETSAEAEDARIWAVRTGYVAELFSKVSAIRQEILDLGGSVAGLPDPVTIHYTDFMDIAQLNTVIAQLESLLADYSRRLAEVKGAGEGRPPGDPTLPQDVQAAVARLYSLAGQLTQLRELIAQAGGTPPVAPAPLPPNLTELSIYVLQDMVGRYLAFVAEAEQILASLPPPPPPPPPEA